MSEIIKKNPNSVAVFWLSLAVLLVSFWLPFYVGLALQIFSWNRLTKAYKQKEDAKVVNYAKWVALITFVIFIILFVVSGVARVNSTLN